jgi:hypothetical protein
MSRVLRSACFFALVSAVAALSIPGCSQQGQGERCDSAKNGDADCDDGLTCVAKGDLDGQTTDRCCPAANTETDTRCRRLSGTINTGGSGNSGGSAGSSTGGSVSPGGAAGEANGGGSAELAAGATGVSDGGSSGSASSSGGMSGAATEGGMTSEDPSGGKGGAP